MLLAKLLEIRLQSTDASLFHISQSHTLKATLREDNRRFSKYISDVSVAYYKPISYTPILAT